MTLMVPLYFLQHHQRGLPPRSLGLSPARTPDCNPHTAPPRSPSPPPGLSPGSWALTSPDLASPPPEPPPPAAAPPPLGETWVAVASVEEVEVLALEGG